MNPIYKSQAREHALKFIYQCEIEKIFYFSSSHFQNFATYFKIHAQSYIFCESLCKQTFDKLSLIDKTIEETSTRWSLQRMPTIDRCLLRIAVSELLFLDTPQKVVINEAIELAKEFGTQQSSKFINGLLDTLAQKIKKQNQQHDTSHSEKQSD